MDGGTRRGHPSLVGSFLSVVLSLEDSRSKKELAEDWIGDKDGLLLFVRLRLSFPIVAHYEGVYYHPVWTFLSDDNRIHHRR
jgi:hypothetical protein